MNAKRIVIILSILTITACAPTTNAVSTAIAPSQAAVPTETFTVDPPVSAANLTLTQTYTPTLSFTSTMVDTPSATGTATITLTPTLTPTPTIKPTGTVTLPASVNNCIPENTTREAGLVVQVVDGDTIDVMINDQRYRVRYIGMDTPERNAKFYPEATEYNRKLVSGKTVTLVKDVSETDKYDRLLRYVLLGEKFVNYELVEQGYAFAFTYPPDTSCADVFVAAQRDAQGGRIGLWKPSSPAPIPPVGVSSGGDSTSGNCDPAYPGVCIPPPPPDLDCKDVPYKRFQVLSPDPHGFDRDNDGIGCES